MQTGQSSSTRIAIDVGLLVTNLEKSLGFYRDLLDLPVVAQVRTSLIGSGQMVQLQYGSSIIKLVALDDGPTRLGGGSLSDTIGYRYITFMVTDIETIMAKLTAIQTPVVTPITQLGNGARIAMVADPDGNIVEFVQET
ncbi:MAG: VOC family protein [Chloroflexota bacterium]